MKKLALILIIGLFALSTNGQSFNYGELVDFKNLSPTNKCTKLTMMGFTYLGDSEMTTRDISDTTGYAWSKGDEQIRFNDESIEYQWFGDSARIKKQNAHKTVYTNISWEMFASSKKYLKGKKKQGTYDADKLEAGLTAPSEYIYLVKEDVYTMMYYSDQMVFIGQLYEVVN